MTTTETPGTASARRDNFAQAELNEEVRSSERFEQVVTDQYRNSQRYPLPARSFFDGLMSVLGTQRLLIICGRSGVNHADLARQVAWYFGEQLQQRLSSPPIATLQWRSGQPVEQIRFTLLRQKSPTIYLLLDLKPQTVTGELLAELKDIAQGHQYIVATTDDQLNSWKLSQTLRDLYWRDIPNQDLYADEALIEALIDRLLDVRGQLPPGVKIDTIAPDAPFCGGWTPRHVVARLRSPGQLRDLVAYITRDPEALYSESQLELDIERVANSDKVPAEEALREWFLTLDSRQRLLALNIGLLSELEETQFFAALEGLVDTVWRHRSPMLSAYDYDDLRPLAQVVELFPMRNGSRLFRLRRQEDRFLLLGLLWNNQRRQVMAALPGLVRIARESVASRSFNRELYSGRESQRRVRTIVSAALSDIGLIDSRAVESSLLDLAADDQLAVQLVAATAMANWRAYGKDAQLFTMLKEWEEGTFAVRVMRTILEARHQSGQEGEQERLRPENFIRATVALTVAQAALFDQRNQLQPRLLKLFDELADDAKPQVRRAITTYVLPIIVAQHPKQLRPSLERLIKGGDYEWPVAQSLAYAYQVAPRDVMPIIGIWSNECAQNRPERFNPQKPSGRERLLATIALTYGEIDYEHGGPLSAEEVFTRLKLMLRDEVHPYVRTAVVIAIARQAERDFDRVAPELQKLLADVAISEREEIVKILVRIYRKQRAEVEGGDATVQLNGARYDVWFFPKERPAEALTKIEQSLRRWIHDPAYPTAQQIALWSFVLFAEQVDRPLERLASNLAQERARASEEQDRALIAPTITTSVPESGWYGGRLVPWLVTIGAPDLRPVIRGVLPEAVRRSRSDRETTTYLLTRWERTDDPRLSKIAPRLNRGISLVQSGCLIIGSAVFVGLVLLCLLLQVLSQL